MTLNTTLRFQKPFRDDLKAGIFLNKHLKPQVDNYTENWNCYYIGDPIKLGFAFGNFMQMSDGWQAEIAIASDGYKFSRKSMNEILSLFFNNKRYNGKRLIALVSPENQQAVRAAKLFKGILEGELREVDRGKNRLLFSILKSEFDEFNIKTKSACGTKSNRDDKRASGS